MPMSPLERKAAFAHAATLREKSRNRAAKEDLGASLTHVQGALDGSRQSSPELRRRIADYFGRAYAEVWGDDAPADSPAATPAGGVAAVPAAA